MNSMARRRLRNATNFNVPTMQDVAGYNPEYYKVVAKDLLRVLESYYNARAGFLEELKDRRSRGDDTRYIWEDARDFFNQEFLQNKFWHEDAVLIAREIIFNYSDDLHDLTTALYDYYEAYGNYYGGSDDGE